MLRTTQYGDVTRFDLTRPVKVIGRYWTTAYLVGDTLVDSGCAHTAPELVQALEGRPLARIVNTHTHEDHIGGNGPLQNQRDRSTGSRRSGLEILAHPLGLPVLADPRGAQPLHPYRRLIWGWPEPSQAQPLADGELIETGQYSFQVIYTPGHSQDHLCLYEARRGWLFTGDLFVGGRDRALRDGCDIWGIIASLQRIAALPATTLYPGSARVRVNPAQALATKIAYLQELGDKVLELDRQGRNVRQITRELCGGPMMIEYITLGHFTRACLVRSYLAAA
jgi:glyoxylase-like metal-dependent hydrolase (beta-lactamase superfamily II)